MQIVSKAKISKINLYNTTSYLLWPDARSAHDHVLSVWNSKWNVEGQYNMATDSQPDLSFPFVPQRKFEAHTILTHLSSGFLNPLYPKCLSPIFELAFFNLCAKDIADFVHDVMSDLIRISPLDWHKRELAKYLQLSLNLADGHPLPTLDPKDTLELISLYKQLAGKPIDVDPVIAELLNISLRYEIENFNQFGENIIPLLGKK